MSMAFGKSSRDIPEACSITARRPHLRLVSGGTISCQPPRHPRSTTTMLKTFAPQTMDLNDLFTCDIHT